ncbi:MAG: carboxypeptidase regulatory-like domain-containing protein [Planctomycetes bacterium]|nr:carboxypeptidase regulatory-like domain-containing protein [Planctomycetota bacterium]
MRQAASRLGLLVVGCVVVGVLAAVWFVGREPNGPTSAAAVAERAPSDELALAIAEVGGEAEGAAARAVDVELAEPTDQVPDGHAVLRLRVLAHEGGAPVEASLWRVVKTIARKKAKLDAPEAPRGDVDHAVRTDARGVAEFVVPSDAELVALCGPPDDVEQAVPPLAEREIRELVLRIGPTADDWFVARVVDAGTKQPIEGAEFLPLSRFASSLDSLEVGARSDARGDVRIDVRAWSPFDALVRAQGYGLRAIPIQADRSGARVDVELERGGPLSIRIEGDKSLRRDIELSLSFQRGSLYSGPSTGKGEQRLRAKLALDEDLTTTVPALPLRTSIEVSSRIRPNAPGHKSVTLVPGEAASVVFDLSRRVAVFGRLVDARKQPIVGTEVALLRDDQPIPILGQLALPPPAQELVLRTISTDERGAFRFEEVPPGRWMLANPPGQLARDTRALAPSVVRIAARRLRLLGDGAENELELTGTRGWMIAGRVVDPEGRAVEGAHVRIGQQHDGFFSDDTDVPKSDSTGEFLLGPIMVASVDVFAIAPDSGFAASERVRVEGVVSHVTLALTRGARIAGTIVPPPSDEDAQQLWLVLHTEYGPQWTPDDDEAPASFAFDGLAPGDYRVVARSPTGRSGLTKTIHVGEGEQVGGVELPLVACARLLVERASEDGEGSATRYRVEVDGQVLDDFMTAYVDEEGIAIPPGHVRILGPDEAASESSDEPSPDERASAGPTPAEPTKVLAEFDLGPGEARKLTLKH